MSDFPRFELMPAWPILPATKSQMEHMTEGGRRSHDELRARIYNGPPEPARGVATDGGATNG